MKALIAWFKSIIAPTPQPKPKPAPRKCTECHKHIARNHKWFYFENGTRHKNCENPTMFVPADENQFPIEEA